MAQRSFKASYNSSTVSSMYGLRPKRIIFNPGTENEVFEKAAQAKGIETIEACTLVMLSVGNY